MSIAKHQNAFFGGLLHFLGKLPKAEAIDLLEKDKIDGPWPRSANEPPPGGKYPVGGSQNIRPMRTAAQALVHKSWQPMEALFETQLQRYGHNGKEAGAFALYESWSYAGPWVAYHAGRRGAKGNLTALAKQWLRGWAAHAALSAIWFRPEKVDILYRGEALRQAWDNDAPKQPPYIFSAGPRNFFGSKPEEGDSPWVMCQPSGHILQWILSTPNRRSPGVLRRERGKETISDGSGGAIALRAIELMTGVAFERDLPAQDFGITEEERAGLRAYIESNGAEGHEAVLACASGWKLPVTMWANRIGQTYVQAISFDACGTKPACMIVEANGNDSWVGLHLPVKYTTSKHTRASGTPVMHPDGSISFEAGSSEGFTARSRKYKQGRKVVWADQLVLGEGGQSEPDDEPDDQPGDEPDDGKKIDLKDLDKYLEKMDEYLAKVDAAEAVLQALGLKMDKVAKGVDRIEEVLEKLKLLKGLFK
jgi:hypothetical protein